jgi:hypothetical protein
MRLMPSDLYPGVIDRMYTLIQKLCAPACGGRAAGSREGEAARAILIDELERAGIAPAGPIGYTQPVPGCGGANLIGRVGRRAEHARHILVCAHYDHLGWHTPGREAYWGADDNAAAVAIAIEVGRSLAADPAGLSRGVLICLFDGEEPPFFLTRAMGSEHFARNPAVPLHTIDLMICMDLVGHAIGPDGYPQSLRQGLYVVGAEKSADTADLCDALAGSNSGVTPMRLGINLLPPLSDYHPFQTRQVPFLFLTCGRWRHYHQVTDTPDRLDYHKMAAIAHYIEQVVRATAERPGSVQFLPEGRDDTRSLETLWSGLSLIAPWSSYGREGLRSIERLIQISRGRSLSPDEFEKMLFVLARLEAILA